MNRKALHVQSRITFAALLAVAGLTCAASAEDTHTPWQVSTDALGPITSETPFSTRILSSAAGSMSFTTGTRSAEGEPYDVIIGTITGRDGEIVITEDPQSGFVGGVNVTIPHLIEGAGGDIGDTFADLDLSSADCFPGVEERSGDFVCFDPELGFLTYWFAPHDYAGPDGELPPTDTMNAATLFEIRWTPGF